MDVRSGMKRRWLATVVMAAMATGACGPGAPPAPRHVVLVTVDTLRADRLGAYGYAKPTSPFLDMLAAQSTLFERAIATAPSTAPAVASLMTGLHRASHGVGANGATLPEHVTTLAEILGARGFRTVARIANPLLDIRHGFAQGFADFAMPPGLSKTSPAMYEGTPVVEATRALLRDVGDAPLFLWLHLYDPHGPYSAPATEGVRFDPADYRWPDDRDLPLTERHAGLFLIPRYQALDDDPAPASYRARYDGEIRHTDAHVRAVANALKERGLWDSTLFVVTSDHGEALGEHGLYFQHGWFAYRDSVHVPLIIRAPGFAPPGRRVAESVSLIDVAPTVLDLLGIAPPDDMEGETLRPFLTGKAADRPAFSQSYHGTGSLALHVGTTAYVFRPERGAGVVATHADEAILPAEPAHELYDLAADPHETRNLAGTRADLLATFRRQATEWLANQRRRGAQRVGAAGAPGSGTTPAPVDPIVESQLRALGYLD